MDGKTVRIYDTTLRDGLRNSRIAIGLDDKVRFVRQLERMGVSDIEVGFGGPAQIATMARLAECVDRPVLYGLSRVNRKDIDRVRRETGEIDPNAFITVEDIQPIHRGFWRA